MSPRLLYLLTVGARREALALRRGAYAGLSWTDTVDLGLARWNGYGPDAARETLLRREERAAWGYPS